MKHPLVPTIVPHLTAEPFGIVPTALPKEDT
ncbi:hypothetical protein SAMN05421512_102323 [Stappia indica]|uniref:Uncharacterized protein n=1 Tax=Stappia indica TaxID=538381 RepID=A0A285RSF7_9HYPH|nr:hypothetical protein SAMN05421512_102323 [Stappia indica]